LLEDGYLGTSDYNLFNDFSFNSLSLDLVYTWRFAPGSDIFIVWKNNILGFDSDETVDYANFNYGNSLSQLGDLPQNNSLSISHNVNNHTMDPIFKNILAVIAGYIVGALVNFGLLSLGMSVIPAPTFYYPIFSTCFGHISWCFYCGQNSWQI